MSKLDQYKRGNYGFNTLGYLVDRFMAVSFNTGRKHYKNMLIIGADAWKELYWKTLRITKHKRVKVDLATMTARIPADSMKVVAVKVVDSCGHGQPLTYDPYKILEQPEMTGCGCRACNCDNEACGILSGISFVSEDVVINTAAPRGSVFSRIFSTPFAAPVAPAILATYQRIVKTKVCANGDLVQEITEPFVQMVGGVATIVFRTYPNHIASLTVKPCGCIENTPANKKTCYDFGCCPVECCGTKNCEPTELSVRENKRGHFKIDTTSGLIYLYDSSAAYVEVSYVSNGEECAEEILIPEYCNEAMYALLYMGSIRYRQGIPSYEKRAAKSDAAVEKQELYQFLNPIVPVEFMDLQHNFPKW